MKLFSSRCSETSIPPKWPRQLKSRTTRARSTPASYEQQFVGADRMMKQGIFRTRCVRWTIIKQERALYLQYFTFTWKQMAWMWRQNKSHETWWIFFFITTRHNPVSFQLFKISFDSNLGEALAYYLPWVFKGQARGLCIYNVWVSHYNL